MSAARLDVDTIVTAALAVMDRDGLSQTTMRKVGAELGADPTAVYRYFPSKHDLFGAVAARLFASVLAQPLPEDWRARLTSLVDAGRSIYATHPTIAEVFLMQSEDAPGITAVNEVVVKALRQAGLTSVEIGRFQQVLVALLIGEGLHEGAWAVEGRDARAAARRAYAALDPDEYPNCTAVAPDLFPAADETFRLHLDLVLDAIEAAGHRNRHTTEH